MELDKDKDQNLNITTNILWSLAGQLAYQLINIFTIIVLMRWVDPLEFGSFYFVYAVFGVLYLFKDFGFSQAIIHKSHRDENLNNSVFWLTIFTTFFFSISTFLISEYLNLQHPYQEIIYLLIIDFFILSLGIIPLTLLNQNLEFATLQKIKISSSIISSIISVILAIKGFGLFSIAFKVLTFNFISTLLAFLYSKWVPKIEFHFLSLKNESYFSLPLLANNFLNYLVRNVDDLLIGQVIGKQSLGFYNRSYYILLLPINNITGIIGSVLFPSLSKIREDVNRVKLTFFKSLRIISLIISPLMFTIIFNTEQIILIFFGDRWLPMMQTLQILSFLCIFQSIGSMFGVLFLIYGKTKQLWILNIYISIFIIIGIMVGVFYYGSIEKTALCYTVTSILAFVPSIMLTSKIINSSVNQFLRPLILPILMSILSNFICVFTLNYIEINNQILNLFVFVFMSIFIYIGSVFILNPTYLNDFKSIFRK